MAAWEEFEIACTRYLNDNFGANARFTHQGGSDSTVPDILVETNSGRSFYIEAKHCPAQCGQFVLLPDITSSSFIYSDANFTRFNFYAQMIINHMNNSFNDYKEAGTRGKEIVLNNGDDIFARWIIDNYRSHGVKFFITNNMVILPIDHFPQYFNVTAKYRVKRSGSASVGINRISNILDYILMGDYSVINYRIDKDKLFVKSQIPLDNKRFLYQSDEYMFSSRGSEYELRKLSNTFNANVIFTISNKPTSECLPIEFIRELY